MACVKRPASADRYLTKKSQHEKSSYETLISDIKKGNLPRGNWQRQEPSTFLQQRKNLTSRSAPVRREDIHREIGGIGFRYTVDELYTTHQELLYALLEKLWKKVTIPVDVREKVLEQHGVPSRDMKVKLLHDWIKKFESSEEARNVLAARIVETFGFEIASGDKEEVLSSAVVQRIPEDHWLEFARHCLCLTEKEIKQFLHQCEFTKEQKYQLIRTYGTNLSVVQRTKN